MTTDQTPDAVRAAIAEIVRKLPYALELTDSGPPTPKDYADAIYDRLAQMGAVPAAGEDTVPIPRKWAVALTTTLHNVSGFHALPEQDRCALRNLSAIVAAALAQIGALRPVGDGVSKAELRAAIADVIEKAVTYGRQPRSGTDRELEMSQRRLYDMVAQMGGVRPVGASMSEAATSVLDRETRHMIVDKWLVSRLGFAESAGHIDEVIADLLDELDAVPAAGTVTFSLEETNIIQDALRHGTSVDEALAMLDERVASYLPDAAARAGDEKGGGAVASE